jgi:isoquinoline 1-oxidoreductase beta subunit
MSAIQNLSRRDVLKGMALSRFMLGASVAAWSPVHQAAAEPTDFAPNLFVAIASTGQVTIVVSRSEMGTGIRTSLAMILADELDADWHDVRVEQAQGDARYGDQNTDGSKSVRLLLNTMREAGATARLMLLTAAARRWNVTPSACHTEASAVVLGAAGKRLRYAELVDDAAKLPVPEASSVRVKSRAAWRYIGKPMPIVDLDDIVHGKAVYGIANAWCRFLARRRRPASSHWAASQSSPATPGRRCRGGNSSISIGSQGPTPTMIRRHIALSSRRPRANPVTSHATMVTR